tara:strand:+ start:741 stop:1598 length:858 start_codon:yes stop_codon:yes gene_type:complete
MKYKQLFIFSSCLSVLLLSLTIWSSFYNMTDNQFYLRDDQISISSYAQPLNAEIFDPNLGAVDSLIQLKSMIHQAIDDHDLSGIDVPIYIDDLVRKKFLHGLATISTNGNWAIKFIDKLFPNKEIISALHPNDIVKSNRAICSQQAILFQELVKEFGFEYESVGISIPLHEPLPDDINLTFNHYASAVKVENDWYYFDSNLEPAYDRSNSEIYTKILAGELSEFNKLYPGYKFKEIKYGMIYTSNRNTFPAKKGVLIQQISKLVSFYGWLVLILLSFVFYRLSKK